MADPITTRRNSVLEFGSQDGVQVVRKRHHDSSAVLLEEQRYARLTRLLASRAGLRIPMLYGISQGYLVMEFVPGPTLAGELGRGNLESLDRLQASLVALLVDTHRLREHFDLDPSNIVVTPTGAVVVDPLAAPLRLTHLSMLIFLHGLIKAALRCLARPWRIPALVSAGRIVLQDYCAGLRVQRSEVLAQLAAYQQEVINWNKAPAREGMLLTVVRRLLFVPVYRLIQAFIRFEARRSRGS